MVPRNCEHCKGDGTRLVECMPCEGYGFVCDVCGKTDVSCSCNSTTEFAECPDCKGKREVDAACPDCVGTGKRSVRE